MTKYRLPRKLKKGCRTLNGNPRTKWQRKGQIQVRKTLEGIGHFACAAVVGMEALRKLADSFNPVKFPIGGIVAPDPPKVGVAQMPTGELVMNHDQIAKLKHVIDIKPDECIRATVSSERLRDVLQGIRERANKEYPIAYG